MPSPDDPLLLWCSSHDTLAAEEIPLFLEAGFRVVPLLTNFWTQRFDPALADTLCPAWRESVALSAETVRGLQALAICEADGREPFTAADLALLAEHVDAVYVTVHPHVAVRLAAAFPRTVLFRAFGHGGLNTYSRICEFYGVSLDDADRRPNLIWCPILSTLQEPEDERLCRNPQHLRAFVTPGRLGPARWSPQASEPFVVETIPRIESQAYYREIFERYVADHGRLPLEILGGNSPGGGALADPRIVGRLDTADYFATAARARISIYHGRSRHHVHYHPIEFMTLGVPVFFHRESAFAAEARALGWSDDALVAAGMYADAAGANRVAESALADVAVAAAIAEPQRAFVDRVFSRPAALEQAVWLRTLVTQRRTRASTAAEAVGRRGARRGLLRRPAWFRRRSRR